MLAAYTGEVRIDRNGIITSRLKNIDSDQTMTAVSAFLLERLNFYLKDYKGFAYDVVNAVLTAGTDDVRDAIARAEALTAARGSEDFAAISAAFKRIKNILRQAEEKGFALGSPKSVKLAAEAQRLADAAAGSCAAGGKASRAAQIRRGPGADRHAAAQRRCFLRQGDGARPRRGDSRRASRPDRRSAAQLLRHRRLQRDRDGIVGRPSGRRLRRISDPWP